MNVLALALALVPAAAAAQAGDSVVYRFAPSSRFEVKTGKAGLFGFAGHDHVIRARWYSGRVVYHPDAPANSRVEIVVPTDSLEVLTPPDTEEIRKVTADMRTEVLDVARYPEIRFESRTVTPIPGGLRVLGRLVIKEVTREVSVDVRVAVGADTLRASGSFAVKQTDFGIRPSRGGPGGTVRVADRVTFRFEALAIREAT
ncbi:MAG: YceI family protein [Gemmatimonadales bacterium]